MGDEASDEYERTLCQLPEVHVFKIPTLKSAGGHRAADWPKDPLWTGRVKIVAKGRLAIIMLIDSANNTFAVCPVSDDAAVERTVDSGRYFALRIQNAQGRHAYIGIAFNERNDAFDFNVALAEHKSECEREDKAKTESSATFSSDAPQKDFSLKDGQKIKINIGGTAKRRDPKPAAAEGFAGGGLLAPPPGSKGLLAPPGSKGLLAPPPTAGYVATATGRSAHHQQQQQHMSTSLLDTTDTSSTSQLTSSFGASDPFGFGPSSSSSAAAAGAAVPTVMDPFGFSAASTGTTPNVTTTSVFQKAQTTATTAAAAAASADPFGFSFSAAPVPAAAAASKPSQNVFGEPNLLDL